MRKVICAALFAAWAGQSGAESTVIDREALFPEGPTVIEGTLYYVEYADNTVMRWRGEGPPEQVWRREGCGPSSVIQFDVRLLVACYDSGEILHILDDGETLDVIAADRAGEAMVGPNDFAHDGRGGVWMTASGPWDSAPIAGAVYHIAKDLTVTKAADDLHYANGIAVAPDGRLFVAESEAARIVQFDVAEDFTLSNRQIFIRIGQVDEPSGPWAYPDGIEMGPDGNLWIGSFSAGRLVAVSPDGSLVKAVEVEGATVPNLAFGPDGEIYAVTVDEFEAPYKGRVLRID